MKRFYKDEQGSSLVLTIITMTFISLLAVAVISLTVTNIRLKIAQKGSQKNFYNTDSIMDEVRAGVEDLAADAAVDAYMEAFSSYNDSLSGTSTNLLDKYQKKFLEQMIENLSGGKSHYGDSTLYYKDEILQEYLMEKDAGSVDRYIPHNGTSAPGILSGGKSYGFLMMQNDTLLLKNVKVSMTEGTKSYKTTLTSDIRVTVPPMAANTSSEYLNYALIADNQIIADANASVEGNMYAGTVKRFVSGALDPETGILIRGGNKLDVKADQLITRGDLVVDGGSTFQLNGLKKMEANLWVENIFTRGNSKNTLELKNSVCNVSDDMELGGKNDVVTIEGKYVGYNYNKNYRDADLKTVSSESEYSSSILVNGIGADLNLSGLNTLILSGRTFISRKTEATELDKHSNPIVNPDIAMGESLSVKGAQIAYYVPSDFIKISSVTTSWNPSENHDDQANRTVTFRYADDLTTEYVFDYGGYMKYLFGLDPQTATDAELDAKISSVTGSSSFHIMNYLNGSRPLEMYYRNDTNVDTNDVTYFYLNFKDEEQLVSFYPDFQNFIPRYSAVKDTNAAYMGTSGIRINNGSIVYCASGNVLYRDPAAGNTTFKIKNESITVDSPTLQKYARQKNSEYLSRQLALVESYQKATDMVTASSAQYRLLNKDVNLSKSGTADDTNVYNLLIDATEMAAKGSIEKKKNDSGTGVIIIEPRAGETYTWNSTEQANLDGLNKGIIISAGNVKIEKNFSGLIIAGGDITMAAAGVKVSSDSEHLEKMFTEDKGSATPYFYNLFSKYFQTVVNSAIGQDDKAVKDVVFYEQWKKESE